STAVRRRTARSAVSARLRLRRILYVELAAGRRARWRRCPRHGLITLARCTCSLVPLAAGTAALIGAVHRADDVRIRRVDIQRDHLVWKEHLLDEPRALLRIDRYVARPFERWQRLDLVGL